jgi:hypothetical protein
MASAGPKRLSASNPVGADHSAEAPNPFAGCLKKFSVIKLQ